MDFIKQFTHHAPSHPEYQGPPQVPPPWVAEWDGQAGRWFFVNQQTGERSWNYPQAGYGGGPQQGGYQQGGYQQGGYQQGGYQQGDYQGGHQQGGYQQSGGYGGEIYDSGASQHQKPSHAGRNAALAGAAGLAGGAFLMHEGEEAKEDWDREEARFESDKDRFEDRVDYDKDRLENGVEEFPQDAANWAGRKVGEVEDIPDDVRNEWDRTKDYVEDVPENAANWVGEEVGRVESYGDGIEDAYDAGRDEERNDDDDDGDY